MPTGGCKGVFILTVVLGWDYQLIKTVTGTGERFISEKDGAVIRGDGV